ncbi:crossover junction endonuclease MUS81 [Protobothrops mucrosquamatus]|uniref:crossover junction endonuclease MUS81 n=1 Tax=Protobothrops mucrosquamatus TaxID=103944 RepID=UPI0010FBA6F9|nr:crossover junction endonuclease MUS81 [Protobothrops mucrosquamatus]
MPKPPQEGPNPLFTQWLQEWRDQAAESGRLKSQRAYERALSSLRKYPLPLRSGCEARILMYFGEKICRQLDEQLERHRSTQDATAPAGMEGERPGITTGGPIPTSLWKSCEDVDHPTSSDRLVLQPAQSSLEPVEHQEQCSKKKQTVPRQRARAYVPTRRSPAYAVLLALYNHTVKPDSRGYLSKPELQKTAQPLCDKSFFLADSGSKNTAWSIVSTLIRKELVLKTNIPARLIFLGYSLTEAGLTVARELRASEELKEDHSSTPKTAAPQTGETALEQNDGRSSGSEISASSSTGKYSCQESNSGLSKAQLVLRPGQFDVILCVDFIETTGYSLTEAGLTVARELRASEELKEDHSSTPKTAAPQTGETALEQNDGSSSGSEISASSSTGKYSCQESNSGLSKAQLVLRPGQFDVILCVDFIETTGGPASCKQELVRELQRHNVPFSIRKLHVGDFLWVARERRTQLPPTTVRELVLDYVVERKRMPDLCGSIIDGRFREQKFRLRQCGLSHPVYLVEDANSVQHLSLPEKTLQQAIVNTQVVDGFFVKRTRDIRESAAYLTVMTRHLTRLYEDKMLLSCTKQELEDERPLQPRESTCRLLTFAEFNEGAVKNKAQTVYEVFARQLMQVSGLSGEKAAAILEKYKTPASLMKAYAACPDAENQEQLLSTIKCGQLQRNLGPSLSKTLAQLYCTPGPLP